MKKEDVLISISKSKVALRRHTRSLSSSVIERLIDNLKLALTEAKEREAANAAKKQTENIKKIKTIMEEVGLSLADLQKFVKDQPRRATAAKGPSSKGKRGVRRGTKVPAKYEIRAEKKVHKWTGRGRMPLVFKEFLERGGTLEQCLIR